MAAPSNGVPGKQLVERNASQIEVGRVTAHRARALVGQAFDLMDHERAKGKRDVVARLVDAYHADPLEWLERVRKLCDDPNLPGKPGSNSLNLQGLFVLAAQQTQQTQAEPSGVQSGYIPQETIDIIDDNEW